MIKSMLIAAALLSAAPASEASAKPQVVATGLRFPEGPIFVGNVLYFVDYTSSSVLRLVDGRSEVVWHQPGCGANGLVAHSAGLLVACFDSGAVVAIRTDGATVSTIRQDDRGHAIVAPNDLAADQKGAVYFSASGSSEVPGKVFHLSANGLVREVASGIQYANGIGISPAGGTLYVAATHTGTVLAYPIESDGSLGTARDFIRLRDVMAPDRTGPATPDSLRVDMQGNVFVALFNGGGVAVVSPAGALIERIDVPLAHHTNLAISPDGTALYVTAVDDAPDAASRGQIIRVANPLQR